MGWNFFAPLILRYGIEGAFKIFQVLQASPEPTTEAWQKLLALGLKSEADYLAEALARSGLTQIPPWVLPLPPAVNPTWTTTTISTTTAPDPTPGPASPPPIGWPVPPPVT